MEKQQGVVGPWTLAGLVWGVIAGPLLVIGIGIWAFISDPKDFGSIGSFAGLLVVGAAFGGFIATVIGLVVGVVLRLVRAQLRVDEPGGLRRTQITAGMVTAVVGPIVMALLFSGGGKLEFVQYVFIVLPVAVAVPSVVWLTKRLPPAGARVA